MHALIRHLSDNALVLYSFVNENGKIQPRFQSALNLGGLLKVFVFMFSKVFLRPFLPKARQDRMKSFAVVAFWVSLLTSRVNENAFLKRQVSTSVLSVNPDSTTSVFSVPTPTTVQTVNGTQHDLSQHFCRIWRHQSKTNIQSLRSN